MASANQWEGTVLNMSPSSIDYAESFFSKLRNYTYVCLLPKKFCWRNNLRWHHLTPKLISPVPVLSLTPPSLGNSNVPISVPEKSQSPPPFYVFFWKSQMFLTESPSQSFRPVLVMVPSPSVSQVLKASRTRSDNRAMAPKKNFRWQRLPEG